MAAHRTNVIPRCGILEKGFRQAHRLQRVGVQVSGAYGATTEQLAVNSVSVNFLFNQEAGTGQLDKPGGHCKHVVKPGRQNELGPGIDDNEDASVSLHHHVLFDP
jgi:hypothetical protein